MGAARRADEGRQQGQGSGSTGLRGCGSVLPLSSASNVNGQDVTVQLKAEGWVFLVVCFSIGFSGGCIWLLQPSLKC